MSARKEKRKGKSPHQKMGMNCLISACLAKGGPDPGDEEEEGETPEFSVSGRGDSRSHGVRQGGKRGSILTRPGPVGQIKDAGLNLSVIRFH